LKPNITSVAHLLAHVTGLVNQELLLKNEYLLAENRILKAHLQPGFRPSSPERTTLAEIGKRLGRKLLQQVASIDNPDTILGWYRKLVAEKFDSSRQRRLPGRPPIDSETQSLVVRLARENSGWGYDRIVGALANLGHSVSDQTVVSRIRAGFRILVVSRSFWSFDAPKLNGRDSDCRGVPAFSATTDWRSSFGKRSAWPAITPVTPTCSAGPIAPPSP
jgi:hypothetical protein